MKQLPEYGENILHFLADQEQELRSKKNPGDSETAYKKFKSELFDESLTAKANPNRGDQAGRRPAHELGSDNPGKENPLQAARPVDVVEGLLASGYKAAEIKKYMKEKHGFDASLKAIEDYVSKKKRNPTGKKFAPTPKQIERIIDRFKSGSDAKEIGSVFGVSGATIAELLVRLGHGIYKKKKKNPESVEPKNSDEEVYDEFSEKMTPLERSLLKMAIEEISESPEFQKSMKKNPIRKYMTPEEIKKLWNEYDRLTEEFERNQHAARMDLPKKKSRLALVEPEQEGAPVTEAVVEAPVATLDAPRKSTRIFKKLPGVIISRAKPKHISSGKDMTKPAELLAPAVKEVTKVEKQQTSLAIPSAPAAPKKRNRNKAMDALNEMYKKFPTGNYEHTLARYEWLKENLGNVPRELMFKEEVQSYDLVMMRLKDFEEPAPKKNPSLSSRLQSHLKKSIADDLKYLKAHKNQIPASLKSHLVKDMKENYALYQEMNLRTNPRKKKAVLTPAEQQELKIKEIDSIKKTLAKTEKVLRRALQLQSVPGQSPAVLNVLQASIRNKQESIKELNDLLGRKMTDAPTPVAHKSMGKSPDDFDNSAFNLGMNHEEQYTSDSKEAMYRVMDNLMDDPEYYYKLGKAQLPLVGLKNPFGENNPTQKKFAEIERVWYQKFLASPLGKSLDARGFLGENKAYDLVEVNSERRKFFDKIRNFAVDCSESIIRSVLKERTVRYKASQDALYNLNNSFNTRKVSKKIYLKGGVEKINDRNEITTPSNLSASERQALQNELDFYEAKEMEKTDAEAGGDIYWRNKSDNVGKFKEDYLASAEYTKATGSKARKRHERTPGWTDEMHTAKLKEMETFRYQKLAICSIIFGMIEPLFQFDFAKVNQVMDILTAGYGIDDYHRFRNMAQSKYRDDFVETLVELVIQRESEPYKDPTLNVGNEPKPFLDALVMLAQDYMKPKSS